MIRPVTVKVVCTILSSPETSLHWTAPHLTLIHDFSNIRLSRPGGCIDHSGSLAERRRRSPHDQAGSGIRTRNLTITKPMINQLSYLAVEILINTAQNSMSAADLSCKNVAVKSINHPQEKRSLIIKTTFLTKQKNSREVSICKFYNTKVAGCIL